MFREKFNYLIVQIKIIQKIDSLDNLEKVNLEKVNLEKINSLEIGRVKKTKGKLIQLTWKLIFFNLVFFVNFETPQY